MSSYSTEEEQIAALKKWWNDNGSSLLIGIGVALAIVFGWKAYQNSVEQERTEASILYQQLITAATSTDINQEGTTVSYLASELKSKFEDSEYALYAAMFLAKESASAGEYDAAKTELNWVLENTEDSRIIHIINGRLARILSAQGEHEAAIDLLEASDPAFEASYLEIIGDINKRAGNESAAIEAYTKAFKLVKAEPQALPLLALKLSDLGVDPETL